MPKTTTRIRKSGGVVIRKALLERAHLQPGDKVDVKVNPDGTITLTSIRPQPSRAEASKAIRKTMKDYARTMKRLSRP